VVASSSHVHALLVLVLVALAALYVLWRVFRVERGENAPSQAAAGGEVVYLPLPRKITNVSVEEAVLRRRSIREYTKDPVRLEHLAMMLWAACGVTEPKWGLKASPSAGATYPLKVYVVVGEGRVLLEGGGYLRAGVYKYDEYKHLLSLVKPGDLRRELAAAALGQEWVEEAPVDLVVCAIFGRTTSRYGERGRVRYVPMEVGHLGQNVYLMATALGYGAVVVGAFHDDMVQAAIGAGREEVPMYIIPIGVPREPPRSSFEDLWKYIEERRRG